MTIVIFSVLALAFSILPIPDRLKMVRRRGNLSFIWSEKYTHKVQRNVLSMFLSWSTSGERGSGFGQWDNGVPLSILLLYFSRQSTQSIPVFQTKNWKFPITVRRTVFGDTSLQKRIHRLWVSFNLRIKFNSKNIKFSMVVLWIIKPIFVQINYLFQKCLDSREGQKHNGRKPTYNYLVYIALESKWVMSNILKNLPVQHFGLPDTTLSHDSVQKHTSLFSQ